MDHMQHSKGKHWHGIASTFNRTRRTPGLSVSDSKYLSHHYCLLLLLAHTVLALELFSTPPNPHTPTGNHRFFSAT